MGGILLLLCLANATAGDEWLTLFNGIDLTGWRATSASTSYTIQDSVLRVRSTAALFPSHLVFVGMTNNEPVVFKNFELKIICRGEAHSNSGVFFHTDFAARDLFRRLSKGYEVQLNNTDKDRRKTGSLYGVVDVEKCTINDTEWFELSIIVQGKNVLVKLNDHVVVSYTEPASPARPRKWQGRLFDQKGGAIALQAHDRNSTWYFKEIKIRRLPD